MRKILLEVTVDWEDYEDVVDELIIEDAIEWCKDGVSWEILDVPKNPVLRYGEE